MSEIIKELKALAATQPGTAWHEPGVKGVLLGTIAEIERLRLALAEADTREEQLHETNERLALELVDAEDDRADLAEMYEVTAATLVGVTDFANECNAVCLCGCPPDMHEDNGEDGEDCGEEGHECLRVAPAVLEIVGRVRLALAEATRERENWIETARTFAKGEGYYRGLIDAALKDDPAAYVADDGSISEDVLRAKLPELYALALSRARETEDALIEGEPGHESCVGCGRPVVARETEDGAVREALPEEAEAIIRAVAERDCRCGLWIEPVLCESCRARAFLSALSSPPRAATKDDAKAEDDPCCYHCGASHWCSECERP